MTLAVVETIELPGGLVRDDGSVSTEAELRPLSGDDEGWLRDCPAHRPIALVTTELLGRTLKRIGSDADPGADVARSLLVGDRDHLLLQLRRITFGDAFIAAMRCPSCHQLMDIAFSAGEIPVERRPQQTRLYERDVVGEDTRSHRVAFHLPTGDEQEAVVAGDTPDPIGLLLARCVELVDGRPANSAEVDELGHAARQQLTLEIERLAPIVELTMDLICPECGHEFDADVDLAHVLLQEMRAAGASLASEVHVLAFYYHWSEHEILALPRAKRRRYIELIGNELSRGRE